MCVCVCVCVCTQDAFGNYVVQYVLELAQPEASRAVMMVLKGQFAELSMQKFSSNVVEKCLKLSGVVSHISTHTHTHRPLTVWQDCSAQRNSSG